MKPPEYSLSGFCDELGRLVQRLQTLRDSIAVTNGDARHVALGGIQQILTGYALGLHSVLYARTDKQLFESLGQPHISAEERVGYVEAAWRLGALSATHFKFDNLVRNLLRALGVSAPRGFIPAVERLWREVGLDTAHGVPRGIRVWTHLRNSTHNNSMHRNAPFTTTIGGAAFTFERNAPVQCASRHHLLLVASSVIDECSTLLSSPRIRALATPIADDFSDAVENGQAVE